MLLHPLTFGHHQLPARHHHGINCYDYDDDDDDDGDQDDGGLGDGEIDDVGDNGDDEGEQVLRPSLGL